jgi:hypothetical protein
MTEAEGCVVLKSRFEAAGLTVVERYPLDGVVLDGYDPEKRIGYEFITTEAGDREELTPAVIAALEARMEKGELLVLLVDERASSAR